jgi:hypothetical protein
VAPGQNIQSAVNAASVNATVCLGSGTHTVASTIKPKAGQTLRSSSASSLAVLRPTTQRPLVIEAPDITVKELTIEGTDAFRPEYGALINGTAAKNILLDKIKISKALIGLGITAGASNIELRQSEIAYAGDGQACSGCAHPSIWINNSNDVRIMKSLLVNNGASPEGDGELACYNSPGLVIHNSTVNYSGAAGLYLVNCDYAVVSGNDILSAGEWGIDLVDTGQPSGTDYGLFSWNLVEGSRHGAGVIQDSLNNTFQSNTYNNNRQGPNASGSCNGINRRGNTSGYYYINDVASPWPVVCND